MGDIVYTQAFLEDMLIIESEALENQIFDAIDLLQYVSVLGSRKLSSSISEKYGLEARKIPVAPFDVIYCIHEGDFIILGLVHQRASY